MRPKGLIYIYNEDLSDEIYEKIRDKYYDLLEEVCGTLEKRIEK